MFDLQKKNNLKQKRIRIIIAICFPSLVLLFWQYASTVGLIKASLVPAPLNIVKTFLSHLESGKLWKNLSVSFVRVACAQPPAARKDGRLLPGHACLFILPHLAPGLQAKTDSKTACRGLPVFADGGRASPCAAAAGDGRPPAPAQSVFSAAGKNEPGGRARRQYPY